MMTCSTCRYWKGPIFQCRRHAPTAMFRSDPVHTVRTEWPKTQPYDSCGDWNGVTI